MQHHSSPTTFYEKLWRFQYRAAPYLFIMPFFILFLVFMAYPLGRSIVLCLYKSSGTGTMRFVGLHNFEFLLTDRIFWTKAVWNTVRFAIVFIALQIPMSLGLALLLNSKNVRFRNLFRFAFFAPNLVGGVFVAVIFQLLLAQRQGLINRIIGGLAPAIGSELSWVGDPKLAIPAIVMASLWLSVGFGMIYFLAALQSVDQDLYEAADIDGAGKWAKFWHVTVPGIRPVLMFLVVVGTIGALQLFELPYVLFQGAGPNQNGLTVVMYLFNYGFEVGDIGFGSAVGWVLVVLIMTISLTQLLLMRLARN